LKLTDTHQHLWDLRQFPYSWCAGIPPLNRSFPLSEYLSAAKDTGIMKTVFVECDVDEPHAFAEARHIQSIADKNPLVAGIVAGGRPEHENFPAHLDKLLGLPKLRGMRRVLHVVPDEISQTTLFVGNVRRLDKHNLVFDICVLARQLPLAAALVEKCPQVQFVLDHCGAPEVKNRSFDPWRANIRRLAALPNVACKISGLVANAGNDWTAEDLQPWTEHVVEQFGFDRIVWGGDWPVCNLTSSLRRWVMASGELFAGLTAAQKEKVFQTNAENIYHI
jgi:predicted TIM-barrel fold metal-dependent hydrolase